MARRARRIDTSVLQVGQHMIHLANAKWTGWQCRHRCGGLTTNRNCVMSAQTLRVCRERAQSPPALTSRPNAIMQTDASRPRQDSSTMALNDWSEAVAAEMERSAAIEIEFMTISPHRQKRGQASRLGLKS